MDTGVHGEGSLTQLEPALDEVDLCLEQVRLVVCTHAHSDHWGQAAPIRDRAGCEFWMHPNHAHATRAAGNPDAALEARLEIARQSGVPPDALQRYADRVKQAPSLIAEVVEPDVPLIPGVEVFTDLGPWTVYETPGHAPSHVCLYQCERRLLISGDHVLGRISLYYDYGWTPDPVGELLGSLDVVDALGARLALSGHGRPFVDVHAHVEGNRRLVAEHLMSVLRTLEGGPRTAVEIAAAAYGQELTPANTAWLLAQTLCYLRHLDLRGVVAHELDDGVERWRVAQSSAVRPRRRSSGTLTQLCQGLLE